MALILVTNLNDTGAGSLRDAVEQADATAGKDTIKFDPSLMGQTITLESGIGVDSKVAISGDIDGDGKADVTLSGGLTSQLFFMSSIYADTTLRGLDMTEGYGGTGGALYVYGDAKLKVVNSTISLCYGPKGAAIGTMYGNVTIVNSLLWNNSAYERGGGIYLNQGRLTVINSTIDNGEAGIEGGGIFNKDGRVTLINSTMTDNYSHTSFNGGAISQSGDTVLTIVNSVIADNFAKNGSRVDITGTIDTAINSVFGTIVTITDSLNTAQFVTNVGLGDLLDNGGTVWSRAPLDGSILIDLGANSELPLDTLDADNDGNTTEVLPIDVRGLARILFDSVDVGAAEWDVNETIHGNDFGNMVFGGIGRDSLYGEYGNDVMDGGAGNDRVLGGDGNDFIKGSAGQDVLDGGTDDDTLLGGSGNDRMVGGRDRDTLTGGAGGDVFVLMPTAGSRDTITDFTAPDDQLEISAAAFGGGLVAGALAGTAFVANGTGTAGDADDRFIYNTATGALTFDSNGSDAGGGVVIAILNGAPPLSAADFNII